MFSSLMPQRKEFYELLAAHSDRVVAGANATLRLVNSLGLGSEMCIRDSLCPCPRPLHRATPFGTRADGAHRDEI